MHQLVYYYMSTTFTVPVALHHQAWSGPDTRWWLSPRTGTCFVSTSLLEVQEPPSSTGSGGLWTTCILFCHLNVCLKTHTGYEIWIFASLIGTTRIWRRRKSRKPEGFSVADWHGDFILGTTLPLHFHVISSCLHNIYAITIILPPLAWHLCWNLVHLVSDFLRVLPEFKNFFNCSQHTWENCGHQRTCAACSIRYCDCTCF